MPKVFLTGATGFVGGDTLYTLNAAHPKWKISALVRNAESAEKLAKIYPDVRTVHGELDDVKLIENEASEADIVLHLAATGHLASVKAIHGALAKRKTGHYIQLSGATILSQAEIQKRNFGEPDSKEYNDLDGVAEIQGLIKKYPNRAVDNFILDAAEESPDVKTAIVFPPMIYGQGRGPVNQRSIQVPELCRIALQRGNAVQIGKGENVWSNVHISDISNLLLRLAEKAASGDTGKDTWGRNGLYLAGASSGITFNAVAKHIAESAQQKGLLSNTTVDTISADEADKLSPHASAILGTNARGTGHRATKLLGWQPSGESLERDIPRSIDVEAARK